MRVIDANVAVGRGEVDLIAMDGPVRVVVEVRTTSGEGDPIDAVDRSKRENVARLARRLGAGRVDFVGVRVEESGVDLHWVPGG